MTHTDTTERSLEELIVRSMTGRTDVLSPEQVATETSVPVAGCTGWFCVATAGRGRFPTLHGDARVW